MKSKMRLSLGTTRPETDAAKAPASATCSTFRSWFRVMDHFSCETAGQGRELEEKRTTCERLNAMVSA